MFSISRNPTVLPGKSEQLIARVLFWATFALLLGRAAQHLLWNGPYSEIFWDQQLMEPLVSGLLGWTWEEYATNLQVEQFIKLITRSVGVLFSTGLVLLVLGRARQAYTRAGLIVGGLAMLLFSVARVKAGHPSWAQGMELAIQLGLPFFLLVFLRYGWSSRLRLFMVLSVLLTFVGHGLFAANWLPTPGHFTQMTIYILGVGEVGATRFLLAVGLLDLLAAGMLLFGGNWALGAALYMTVWGCLTALARTVAPWGSVPVDQLFLQWLPETLFRLPHGMVPFALAVAFGFSLKWRAPRPA